MKNYEKMTKYIPFISNSPFGEWIIDNKNDGTTENPIQMPFVNYSDMVRGFMSDVYQFEKEHEDFELNRYVDILKEHGIEWGQESMLKADVNDLSGKTIMALIMGAVRAERFCEGTLFTFFEEGAILKWLECLQRIDNE